MTINDSRRLVDQIKSASKDVSNLSDENQSRLAQLMVIWVSGYLEATCKETLQKYTERHANPSVRRYVGRHLNRFTNPKVEKIIELVKSFDKDNARKLEEFVEQDMLESINSVVGQRNLIAHGRSTSITAQGIETHFQNAQTLANKLKSLFNV